MIVNLRKLKWSNITITDLHIKRFSLHGRTCIGHCHFSLDPIFVLSYRRDDHSRASSKPSHRDAAIVLVLCCISQMRQSVNRARWWDVRCESICSGSDTWIWERDSTLLCTKQKKVMLMISTISSVRAEKLRPNPRISKSWSGCPRDIAHRFSAWERGREGRGRTNVVLVHFIALLLLPKLRLRLSEVSNDDNGGQLDASKR